MKVTVPDYYYEFVCLADRCPDTCCKGWLITVDDDAYSRYMNSESPLKKRFAECLETDADNVHFFRQTDGRCPFLNENGLCDIIIQTGEDNLCSVCERHPKFIEEYGNFKEICHSLSCPETVGLLFSKTDIMTFRDFDDGCVPEYETDEELTDILLAVRNTLFSIISNPLLSPKQSAAAMLLFAKTVQNCYDNFMDSELYALCEAFADTDSSADILKMLGDIRCDGFRCPDYASVLSRNEILTDEWKELLSRSEGIRQLKVYEDVFFRNLLAYFVFRYVLKAVNDENILSKVSFAVFSVCAVFSLYDFETDVKETARLYSKEVEHDTDNVERMYSVLDGDGAVYSLLKALTE